MGSDLVIMASPVFDHDLCFGKRIKDFAVKQLIAQGTIKPLIEAILPWAARGDIGRLYADLCQPLAHIGGCKLTAIVTADVIRDPV